MYPTVVWLSLLPGRTFGSAPTTRVVLLERRSFFVSGDRFSWFTVRSPTPASLIFPPTSRGSSENPGLLTPFYIVVTFNSRSQRKLKPSTGLNSVEPFRSSVDVRVHGLCLSTHRVAWKPREPGPERGNGSL